MNSPAQKTRLVFRIVIAMIIVLSIPVGLMLLSEKLSPKRQVASLHGNETVFKIDGNDKALKYKLLATALKDPSNGELHLGLPTLVNNEGRDVPFCEEFPTLDWILSADGLAVSGNLPQITVRTQCLFDPQTNQIVGPPIPFKEIFKLTPENHNSLNFTWKRSPEEVQVFIRNGASHWPTVWTWTGLRFYGKDPKKILNVDGYEIISVLGNPIIFTATE